MEKGVVTLSLKGSRRLPFPLVSCPQAVPIPIVNPDPAIVAERDHLQNELNMLDAHYKRLEQDLAAEQGRHKVTADALTALQGAAEEDQIRVEGMKQEYLKLQNQLHEAETSNIAKDATIEQLKTSIRKERDTNEKLKSQLDAIEKEDLHTQLLKSNDAVKDRDRTINRLNAEHQQKSDTAAQLNGELAKKIETLENENRGLQSAIKAKTAEFDELRQQIAAENQWTENEAAQAQKYNDAIQELDKKNKEQADDIKRLQTKVENDTASIMRYKAAVELAKTIEKDTQNDLEALIVKHKKVEAELVASTESKKQLEDELINVKKNIERQNKCDDATCAGYLLQIETYETRLKKDDEILNALITKQKEEQAFKDKIIRELTKKNKELTLQNAQIRGEINHYQQQVKGCTDKLAERGSRKKQFNLHS